MAVKLLTEQHLEFLSLKCGCIGSYEVPYCFGNHVSRLIYFLCVSKHPAKEESESENTRLLLSPCLCAHACVRVYLYLWVCACVRACVRACVCVSVCYSVFFSGCHRFVGDL